MSCRPPVLQPSGLPPAAPASSLATWRPAAWMPRASPTAAGQLHCIVIHATQFKPTRLQVARSERCHERQAVPIGSGGLHRRPCAVQTLSLGFATDLAARSNRDFPRRRPTEKQAATPRPDRPKLLFSAAARRSSREAEPGVRDRAVRGARALRHADHRRQVRANEGEREAERRDRDRWHFRAEGFSPSTLLVWITARAHLRGPAAAENRPRQTLRRQTPQRHEPPPLGLRQVQHLVCGALSWT